MSSFPMHWIQTMPNSALACLDHALLSHGQPTMHDVKTLWTILRQGSDSDTVTGQQEVRRLELDAPPL